MITLVVYLFNKNKFTTILDLPIVYNMWFLLEFYLVIIYFIVSQYLFLVIIESMTRHHRNSVDFV
jgi:hypothetical protein